MRRKAYISLLSLKIKEGAVKVVEDISVKDGKTKEMSRIGKSLGIVKGVLISAGDDSLLKRAIRNIPWFGYNNVKRLSGRDIFYSKTLVITEGAVKSLSEMFSKGN